MCYYIINTIINNRAKTLSRTIHSATEKKNKNNFFLYFFYFPFSLQLFSCYKHLPNTFSQSFIKTLVAKDLVFVYFLFMLISFLALAFYFLLVLNFQLLVFIVYFIPLNPSYLSVDKFFWFTKLTTHRQKARRTSIGVVTEVPLCRHPHRQEVLRNLNTRFS